MAAVHVFIETYIGSHSSALLEQKKSSSIIPDGCQMLTSNHHLPKQATTMATEIHALNTGSDRLLFA